MSLDGFIAGPNDDMQRIFGWMFGGDTEFKVTIGEREMPLKVSAASAELLQEMYQATGAIVSGRGMFDTAHAWGGKHPIDVPVFVVTHTIPQEWAKEGSPFTFVKDGVESAVEQAQVVAGDKSVGVGGADVTRQCLRAGLLDEIQIDLVPVLLGNGVRLFEHLGIEPVELETVRVVEGTGVTHLRFRVLKETKETHDLIVTRVFDAPVAQVWKAWSESEQVMRWWGPTGFTCSLARMDFRVGGTSLVCMRAPKEFGGQDLYNTWTYQKIAPMQEIEFVLNFADKDGNRVSPTTLGLPPDIPDGVRHVITFTARGDNQTEMTVTEYGYTSEQALNLSRMGLEQCLDKMAATFTPA
jgi:uncharacterized protein YndB with AHSA1/START domain/dihydrofolate reductase